MRGGQEDKTRTRGGREEDHKKQEQDKRWTREGQKVFWFCFARGIAQTPAGLRLLRTAFRLGPLLR